ncbi:hypothetical protein DAEQUDRAFT_135741 [Daedalea quercina L-15889]|uniref:Cytochrome P450 n=1 Tax=Daedalea quercina L-15889 TaxID=1314783 RepID=A0A165RRH4_9APHY|nr:hypothetical protein DAEQUDRAFT_135741 [Daedalea quercina L-15889]
MVHGKHILWHQPRILVESLDGPLVKLAEQVRYFPGGSQVLAGSAKCGSLFRYITSSIYSDTTFSAIEAFVLAMSVYPQVQKNAQLELDTVLGPGHLAKWDDLPRLPCMQALLYEVFRGTQ